MRWNRAKTAGTYLSPNLDNGPLAMDATSSSTQNAVPFSYEAMPNEIHQTILSQIPEVNSRTAAPTLRSVSRINQQLHGIAMPFLMECYVSTVENALPGLSSEKKVETLTRLKNWLTLHHDPMPTNAYLAAFKRTQKLADGLNPAELELLVSEIERSLPTSGAASGSVNNIIAIQMSISSYSSASNKLATHYRNCANWLQTPW